MRKFLLYLRLEGLKISFMQLDICNCTCDYRYSFHTCIVIFNHIHSDGSLATFNQWLCSKYNPLPCPDSVMWLNSPNRGGILELKLNTSNHNQRMKLFTTNRTKHMIF